MFAPGPRSGEERPRGSLGCCCGKRGSLGCCRPTVTPAVGGRAQGWRVGWGSLGCSLGRAECRPWWGRAGRAFPRVSLILSPEAAGRWVPGPGAGQWGAVSPKPNAQALPTPLCSVGPPGPEQRSVPLMHQALGRGVRAGDARQGP